MEKASSCGCSGARLPARGGLCIPLRARWRVSGRVCLRLRVPRVRMYTRASHALHGRVSQQERVPASVRILPARGRGGPHPWGPGFK